MQMVFKVNDVVVFEDLPTVLQNLMGVKPSHKRKRENPKAKVEELPLLLPKPQAKVRISRLPYVALYFCERCGVFYKGF